MSLTNPNKVLHLSGLNGIRAIAALAVVISHTTQSLSEFNLNPFIFGTNQDGFPKGLDLAGFGVSMFFSLSGFLITYLLLLEKESQEINVKNFYIRRILRIHPLYFSYLAICLAIIFFFNLQFSAISLVYYVFFAANISFIIGIPLPLLAHYWSLGVEEQFYIFYPWIVKKIKSLSTFLILATVFLIIVKLIARVIDIKYGIPSIYLALQVTRFQCMLIGAVGAIYYYEQSKWFLKYSTNIFVQLFSWFCVLLLLLNSFHLFSVLDQEIISIITLFIIMGQITKTNRIINLDFEAFDFIGKISYGIYVIHPVIVFTYIKVLPDLKLPLVFKYLLVYLVILVTTIFVAYISYQYFEKWFLSMKYKYSSVKTSATKHSQELLLDTQSSS
ncbi:MAG: acyltransferase [Pyrinomonadaceae bacterium]|nr:acyltransferase [Pyrinomonadaceae bacterium]